MKINPLKARGGALHHRQSFLPPRALSSSTWKQLRRSICLPRLRPHELARKQEDLDLDKRTNTDCQDGSLTHRPYTAEDGQILDHLFFGQPRLEKGHQQRQRLRRLLAFRRHVSWWKGKRRVSMMASAEHNILWQGAMERGFSKTKQATEIYLQGGARVGGSQG